MHQIVQVETLCKMVQESNRKIADLERQLAEAQTEIKRLREKLGWVPAVFDVEALRPRAENGTKI